jgi:hypothetical protein
VINRSESQLSLSLAQGGLRRTLTTALAIIYEELGIAAAER